MDKVIKKTLELKEQNCITFLKKFKNKAYICFSGGKDSLVTLDLAFRSGINNVVFCDTTIEFQETIETIDEVEKYYEVIIDKISAPCEFFQIVHKLGFPSRTMRWCCKVFKFTPLSNFAREKGIKSFITGLRSEEHIRRANYKRFGENKYVHAKQINPIIDWSEKEVWFYINKYHLPINSLYKLGFNRVGCWPCPFKTKKDWNLIKTHFPKNYNLLQNTIRSILKDCEGIGIKDLTDFISNYKWASYTRPQNSELKGKIEVLPQTTLIHLENSNQVNKIKQFLPILSKDYQIIRNSIVINKKLRRQSVKILVEKSLNCIGCGACTSFCRSMSVKDNCLIIDGDSCKSCLKCLNTSIMRGACIMRNFSPFRFEVQTCQDLIFENQNDTNLIIKKSRIGLVRTRKSLENITEKFKNIAEVKNNHQFVNIKNGKFEANVYKSKGFVEVKIFPRDNNLEEAMNFYRKVMSK